MPSEEEEEKKDKEKRKRREIKANDSTLAAQTECNTVDRLFGYLQRYFNNGGILYVDE